MVKTNTEFAPPKAIFGEFEKKDDLKIVISLQEYRGSEYLDFRENWKPDDQPDFRPTKKGFTFSVEEPELAVQAIDKMIAALEKAKKHILAE